MDAKVEITWDAFFLDVVEDYLFAGLESRSETEAISQAGVSVWIIAPPIRINQTLVWSLGY